MRALSVSGIDLPEKFSVFTSVASSLYIRNPSSDLYLSFAFASLSSKSPDRQHPSTSERQVFICVSAPTKLNGAFLLSRQLQKHFLLSLVRMERIPQETSAPTSVSLVRLSFAVKS